MAMASGRTRRRANAGAEPRGEPARRASGDSGKIQSLKRASSILDAVARRPEGVSLAQISAEVGLRNSTAFHLIQTLVNLGFLTQLAESRRYRIGIRLFTLAAGALDETALLGLATPILERLSAETGQASHLAVRARHDIVVIARTAASGLLQLAGHPGATRPAHATAIGKMLLSAMPPQEFERLLETLPLPAFTPKTLTDRQSLREEIAVIRATGIAHDNCELDADVRCIAVPVYDFAGRCAAAMGLSGPVWRLTPEAVEEKARLLRTAAADLSAQLGAGAAGQQEPAPDR
jgi:DNA-binding IclR family transcriptional regulator